MAPAGLAAPMANSLCSRSLYKRHQINLLLSFLPLTGPCSPNSGRDLGKKELPFPYFHPVLFPISRNQSAPGALWHCERCLCLMVAASVWALTKAQLLLVSVQISTRECFSQ